MPLNTQSTLAQPWLKLTLISSFVFISDNPSDFSSGRTFYSCWFDGKLFEAQWVKCKLYNYCQFVKWWVTMYFSWCYLYQRFLYKLIFCCFCCSCVFFFTWLLSWKRHVRWIRRYVFVDRFSENVTGYNLARVVWASLWSWLAKFTLLTLGWSRIRSTSRITGEEISVSHTNNVLSRCVRLATFLLSRAV